MLGVVDPEAVRPDDAHAGRTSNIPKRDLILSAALPRFGEPGAEDYRRFHAGGSTCLNRFNHCRCGYRDDRGINRLGHIGDVGERGEALNRLSIWVNWVNAAREPCVPRVL